MTDKEMELIFKTAYDLTLPFVGKQFQGDPLPAERESQVKKTIEIFTEIATELKSIHSKLKS